MDCPKCKMPGAYLGFSKNECRNKKCENYTETCERTCPVCGGAAGCPGFVIDDYAVPPFRHVVEETVEPPAVSESPQHSPDGWVSLKGDRRFERAPCAPFPHGCIAFWFANTPNRVLCQEVGGTLVWEVPITPDELLVGNHWIEIK